MIKFKHTDVYGWEAAIRGMRNPMNSWEKSDSSRYYVDNKMISDMLFAKTSSEREQKAKEYADVLAKEAHYNFHIGPNDHNLMMSLAKSGTEHSKYRRMINVTVDITAPLYWWKEFDTYKVGTVANSCSTMHKIAAKEFTLEDFSVEHLGYFDPEKPMDDQYYANTTIDGMQGPVWPMDVFTDILAVLNKNRVAYLETKDKRFWWQMIQMLPSSYNQRRTVQMNYEVLASIYRQRKDHKLDEWHLFCDWIAKLPYSEIITLGENNE